MTLAPELDPAPTAPLEGTAGAARRSRRGRGPTRLPLRGPSGLTLGVVMLWLSLLVLLPLVAVVGKAFDRGWGGFADALGAADARRALTLTLGLALSVAAVNAVMGTLVAWVLVRERFRGAAALEAVIDIPFALPTVVAGIVMGTLVAWVLVRERFRGAAALEAVIDIPFALPTVVAGIVMLALYGNESPVGVTLFGTWVGLFVALLFVTLPFTVRTVQPVLLDLDRDAEQAAASLGAAPVTVFRRIVLPQILPAALSGAALSFARAIGEYGSLVFLSSNTRGNRVAPALIYGKLQDADHPGLATQQAGAIAFVLLLASALVLAVLFAVQRAVAGRG